jgi:two-component system chemotaxis response regulator CheV
MDGHMLIKNIRGDFNFDDIPIVIFSSLINEDTKRKGIKLGADVHITKPEIGKLVHVIDDLIVNGRK